MLQISFTDYRILVQWSNSCSPTTRCHTRNKHPNTTGGGNVSFRLWNWRNLTTLRYKSNVEFWQNSGNRRMVDFFQHGFRNASEICRHLARFFNAGNRGERAASQVYLLPHEWQQIYFCMVPFALIFLVLLVLLVLNCSSSSMKCILSPIGRTPWNIADFLCNSTSSTHPYPIHPLSTDTQHVFTIMLPFNDIGYRCSL